MSTCLAVGIDLGTTNTKVVLAAITAGRVEIRRVASAPTPEPGSLKPLLLKLLRRALAGSPPPDAIGIASMAETGVPLDRADRPLGPWLRWDAHRAGREAAALSRNLGWAELVRATGARPSAKVPLAVWAWLRAQRPEQWEAMARWAGVADLACLLLTGEFVTDHTLAGRTMAYRLPPPGEALPDCFDPHLLAEVGLRPEQLPAVTPPDRVAGRVVDPAFVSCGLRRGTPVAVAGHDHAVGAYAAGVREPGAVANSLGTAEAVMSVVAGVPDPIEAGRGGMSTVVPAAGRHRAFLAGSSSAGATVAWWLEHESGGLAAEELFARVLTGGDRPTGVLVLPYLSGRQAPEPDPAATLRVLGRQPHHTPVELARAMLEGLCLQTRWMLEEQARLGGNGTGGTASETGIESVTVLGGAGAANAAWTRVKAQVLPWPLRMVAVSEPVAAGAALLAAVRAGQAGPDAPILDRVPVTAGAGTAGGYGEMFARFIKAETA